MLFASFVGRVLTYFSFSQVIQGPVKGVLVPVNISLWYQVPGIVLIVGPTIRSICVRTIIIFGFQPKSGIPPRFWAKISYTLNTITNHTPSVPLLLPRLASRTSFDSKIGHVYTPDCA